MLLLIGFPVTDKPTRRAVGPARNRVASGHMRRRRQAALFPARAREERGEKSVSAPTRGLWRNQPCPPATQWTPAACRVCRPRNSESALRMPPPGKRPDAATSAMPPGSPRPVPSRTNRPSRLPCRHVAAFQTSAHPPPLSRPRPGGPQKESPQSKAGCRPRKLRVHPSFHCGLLV